jgi:hypothetical protein
LQVLVRELEKLLISYVILNLGMPYGPVNIENSPNNNLLTMMERRRSRLQWSLMSQAFNYFQASVTGEDDAVYWY